MSEPSKQGLTYFPLDVNFLQDIKVKKIRNACHTVGITVLLSLLTSIYRDCGYYIEWDNDLSFLIADEFGVSEGAVTETIMKALQVNFFDNEMFKNHKILTSRRIQRTFIKALERRKQIEMIAEFMVIDTKEYKNVILISISGLYSVDNNPENVYNNPIEPATLQQDVDINPENVDKTQQSKGKESKEKNKEIYSPAEPPDEPAPPEKIDYSFFMEQFNALPSFPKIRTMTDKRKKSLKVLLNQYSQDDILTAFTKAESSDFLSGRTGKWSGCGFDWIINSNNFVKLLEGNYDNKPSEGSQVGNIPQRPNRFANFPQRKRDYEKLEKMETELLMKGTQGGMESSSHKQ